MRRALAFVNKELRVLRHDVQALVVLFVMPAVFILIISVAARDTFAEHGDFQFEFVVLDVAGDARTDALVEALAADRHFLPRPAAGLELERGLELLRRESFELLVHVPPGFWEAGATAPLEVRAAPTLRPAILRLFEAHVRQVLAVDRLRALSEAVPAELDLARLMGPDRVRSRYEYGPRGATRAPTAVQQSVPAWLIFSMFFVLVPLANTFISERREGTLARLRTMGVSGRLMFPGKIVPYMLVHLVQALAMLAVGFYLVPLFGGDALELGGSPVALLLVTLSVSLAALGLALLIAVACRTTEQATAFGAFSVIVLAALGGLMVPRFVMPVGMRQAALCSPMAWGLEGYLDVFLRGGGSVDVLPECGVLLAFAAACLIPAALLFRARC